MARKGKAATEKPTREELSERRKRASAIAVQARREKAKLKEPLTQVRVYVSDNRTLNEICASEELKNLQDTIRYLIRHHNDTRKPHGAVDA